MCVDVLQPAMILVTNVLFHCLDLMEIVSRHLRYAPQPFTRVSGRTGVGSLTCKRVHSHGVNNILRVSPRVAAINFVSCVATLIYTPVVDLRGVLSND